MPIVKVGDQRIKFPDSMSKEEIQSALTAQFGGGQQPVESPLGGRGPGMQRPLPQEGATTAQATLQQIEAGQVSAQDLTPSRVESIQRERIESLPSLVEEGITGLTGAPLLETLPTAAVALTTLDPKELGKVITSQFPHVGITHTPEGEQIAVNNQTGKAVIINRPGISSLDIMQGLGLVAAFTPAARAASAPAFAGKGLAAAAGTQAVGAGVTEAALQGLQSSAGGEFNSSEIALAAVLGGGAELAGPAARNLLERARKVLRSGQETAEQAARRQIIEKTLDVQPTRAQVTQQPAEFQMQQEIAKGGGAVREVLDIQEKRIGEVLEQAAERTGGRVATSESTPINEVLNRSLLLDDQIGVLYKQARESAPIERNITLKDIKGVIQKNSGFETKSGGVLSAARSILEDKGITLVKPRDVAEIRRQDISAATAEDIRQQLNSLFEGANPTGRRIIRELKDALDNDVLKQAGKDVFEEARSAKAAFEENLKRAGVSKFDKRGKNLVRDMLENKVNPDTFVSDVVLGKSFRKEDIKQLKNFLSQTDSGIKAWDDLRAQAVNEIRVRSFNQKGELIPSKFGQTLDKMGAKGSELFTSAEQQMLNNLREVIRLRTPTRAEATGRGPSAQAIQQFRSKFPLIGSLLDGLSDFRKNKFLLRLPKRVTEDLPVGEIKLPPQAAQATRQEDK